MSALSLEALTAGIYAAVRTWFYLELLVMALEYLAKHENWVPKMSDTRPIRIGFSLFTGIPAACAFFVAKPAIEHFVATGVIALVAKGIAMVAIVHAVEWITFLLYLWLFNPRLLSIPFWNEHGSALRDAVAARRTALWSACKQRVQFWRNWT